MANVKMEELVRVQTVGPEGIGVFPPIPVEEISKVSDAGLEMAQVQRSANVLPHPGAVEDGSVMKEENDVWTGGEGGGGGSADIDLGVTDASVGDYLKVKTVDEDGKPTAWESEPVDTEAIIEETDAWLEDNIAQETGYVLDSTLSLENAAAPAKVVGDKLTEQSEAIDEFSDILGYETDITDRFHFTNGQGVRYTTGALYSNSSASYSDYVDVSDFNRLVITIRHVTSATNAGIAFYKAKSDSSDNVTTLTREPYGQVESNTFTPITFNLSENDKYVRTTWYPTTSQQFSDYDFKCVGYKNGAFEKNENITDAVSNKSGIVEYWDKNEFYSSYNSNAYTAVTTAGIDRKGEVVTLNKTAVVTDDIRVRLDGTIKRTTNGTTFTTYSKEIPFISGHKYRFSVKYISGTSNIEEGVNLFIRDSSNTSVVSLKAGDVKDYVWEDSNGTILLWVDGDYIYTDYKFRLSIVDLDVAIITEEVKEIKQQYSNELTTTIASSIAKIDEPCLVFPLVSDIHYASVNDYGYLFDDTINNIRGFAENVKCDGLICLGDITDGGANSTQPQTIPAAISLANILFGKMNSLGMPVFFSIGNHDDCRYMSTGMTTGQIYAHYMKQAEQDVIPDLDPTSLGTNYYKDFSGYKTRLININTNILPTPSEKGQYGITQETLTWLGNVLDSMPEDYIGMIITHAPISDDLEYSDGTTIDNSDDACEIIENCGKACFAISGHTHFDASSNDGFLKVVVAANKFSQRDTDETFETAGGQTAYLYTRNGNDYTADLWDVVIVRPQSKKVNFIRFGSGIDREFDLN